MSDLLPKLKAKYPGKFIAENILLNQFPQAELDHYLSLAIKYALDEKESSKKQLNDITPEEVTLLYNKTFNRNCLCTRTVEKAIHGLISEARRHKMRQLHLRDIELVFQHKKADWGNDPSSK
jgi:hypothetical protein